MGHWTNTWAKAMQCADEYRRAHRKHMPEWYIDPETMPQLDPNRPYTISDKFGKTKYG